MCVCTLVLPPPLQKLRALKCLRRVLNGLSTKRFVMEPPKPGSRTAFIGACFRARMVVCVCVCYPKGVGKKAVALSLAYACAGTTAL